MAANPGLPLYERPLRREELVPDPRGQYDTWLDEARSLGVELPEAAALATADATALPPSGWCC